MSTGISAAAGRSIQCVAAAVADLEKVPSKTHQHNM